MKGTLPTLARILTCAWLLVSLHFGSKQGVLLQSFDTEEICRQTLRDFHPYMRLDPRLNGVTLDCIHKDDVTLVFTMLSKKGDK